MSTGSVKRRSPVESGAFSVSGLPKRLRRTPFSRAAALALPGWELSLAFIPPEKARALNIRLRGKDYVPNVLSYRVGKMHGEVLICPAIAKKQAPDFGLPADRFLLLLFIHGCLHLEGLPHGATMERKERALVTESLGSANTSNTHGTKNRNRHRHRNAPGQDRRH
ncbi:MAG: rRNA maturation RNase YbeY [Patescibacteria group bacterium]|nr:rRNA maturation RNase YbeY [Patescibacteria group bacterium]MDE1966258.1 rRNA maturation RNase YbeY [Patescibacteria group bacterium]